MTRDGLTEENLRDGAVKNISHKSRGRPDEKVSGYRKKLRKHEKIPDATGLDGQKQAIRKKQIRRQMTKEQAKAGRLSFDDGGNQMVQVTGSPGLKRN